MRPAVGRGGRNIAAAHLQLLLALSAGLIVAHSMATAEAQQPPAAPRAARGRPERRCSAQQPRPAPPIRAPATPPTPPSFSAPPPETPPGQPHKARSSCRRCFRTTASSGSSRGSSGVPTLPPRRVERQEPNPGSSGRGGKPRLQSGFRRANTSSSPPSAARICLARSRSRPEPRARNVSSTPAA